MRLTSLSKGRFRLTFRMLLKQLLPLSILNFVLFKTCSRDAFQEAYKKSKSDLTKATVKLPNIPTDPEVVKSVAELKVYFHEIVDLGTGPSNKYDFSAGLKAYHPKLLTDYYIYLTSEKGSLTIEIVLAEKLLVLGMKIVKCLSFLLGKV